MNQTVHLQPGQSKTARFNVIPTSDGTYNVSIGDHNAQFEVLPLTDLITVDEMFVCVNKYGTGTADYESYIRLRNLSSAQLSGRMRLTDWQEWCGERRWHWTNFTILPGDVHRYRWESKLHEGKLAYARYEIEIGGEILESPRAYFEPGKVYVGDSNNAYGQCIRSETGIVTLWYSQKSECTRWSGSYRTPPRADGDAIYIRSFEYNVKDYRNKSWPAVFLTQFDADLITGARYEAYIMGGDTTPRHVYFTWTHPRYNY